MLTLEEKYLAVGFYEKYVIHYYDFIVIVHSYFFFKFLYSR